MSNAKIISLIAHATSRVQSEDERARTALAADLYDTLRAMTIPLVERLDAIEAELAQLRRATNDQPGPPAGRDRAV